MSVGKKQVIITLCLLAGPALTLRIMASFVEEGFVVDAEVVVEEDGVVVALEDLVLEVDVDVVVVVVIFVEVEVLVVEADDDDEGRFGF